MHKNHRCYEISIHDPFSFQGMYVLWPSYVFSHLPKSRRSSDFKRQEENTTALLVEDELSAQQPNNTEGTGLSGTNDQVKLTLIQAFLLPLATCKNPPGQAALTKAGFIPSSEGQLRVNTLNLRAPEVTPLGDTASASSSATICENLSYVPLQASICS